MISKPFKVKNATILVVDDDRDLLTAATLLLKNRVKQVITEYNPENIPTLLSRYDVDLMLLDMNFKSAIHTGNEGLYWLSRVSTLKPQLPVILITAYGAIDLAVKSLKQGAVDFVVKPWQNEQLLAVIEETLANQKKGKPAKPAATSLPMELIGESAVMQELFYKIKKIAPTDANILILGENGTGKDLIAAAIHAQSRRAEKPYVKVDVGSLTDTLFESELFGHKKGAFTDAREDREGRFEAANGGTLFLDEIGNIPLRQQAKLLTALQNRQVVPLGSNVPVPVDIRLLCATNVPLETLADESRFRRDLIYRINTVELQVPPLRARGQDIVLIANHFLKKYAAKYLKPEVKLGDAAREKLLRYHYPGNVRELQYSMERAVIMAEQEVLTPADIIFSPIENKPYITPAETTMAEHNLGELERVTIRNVVDKHNGNITKAAKELGITRAALYRRLNKYDI